MHIYVFMYKAAYAAIICKSKKVETLIFEGYSYAYYIIFIDWKKSLNLYLKNKEKAFLY